MLHMPTVNKVIKESDRVYFGKYETGEYLIMTTHVVIKTYDSIKGALLTSLEKMFGQLPQRGTCFRYNKGNTNTIQDDEILEKANDFLTPTKDVEVLQNTNLSSFVKFFTQRGITTDIYINKNKQYIYIDKRYTDMLDRDEIIRVKGTTPLQAVFISGTNTEVMFLPERLPSERVNKYLKNLEEQ